MPKLQESQGQFTLCIPQELVQAKKWKKGDVLLLAFNERGNIEIKEVKP